MVRDPVSTPVEAVSGNSIEVISGKLHTQVEVVSGKTFTPVEIVSEKPSIIVERQKDNDFRISKGKEVI